MTWLCAQIGAREHYAVPRALHQAGRLAVLYTDFWAGLLTKTAARSLKSGALRSLAARGHPGLLKNVETLKTEIKKSEVGKISTPHPDPLSGRGGEGGGKQEDDGSKIESGTPGNKFQLSAFSSSKAEIVSWNLRALWWEVLRKRKTQNGKRKWEMGDGRSKMADGREETAGRNLTPAFSPDEAEREKPPADANQFQLSTFSVSAFTPYHGFIEVGRRFATCVRENLKRRKDLEADSIFYAYDTGALEAFEWCREQGIKCVLNQMDPNRVEVALVRTEEKLWPGWAVQSLEVPEAYFNRREREWALADRIVVNSEFSRHALMQQGVPPEKLAVIPLCYEAAELNRKPEVGSRKSDESLRVLFLGQVILRKGIQYLTAAARLLEKENIHFDIVGPLGISAAAIATAPKNMTFHGRTGRDQAAAWYQQSHVFVLPTLSDGFAITQLEAMAHGLPVVTTPCCGEVVSDGVDGFIVPPREVEALVQTFRRYLAEPELLRNQSSSSLVKASQFTFERLAENLQKLEDSLIKTDALKG